MSPVSLFQQFSRPQAGRWFPPPAIPPRSLFHPCSELNCAKCGRTVFQDLLCLS